jgi:hypothetical protein
MNTFASAAEMQALEKLRDDELEEARALQSVMLPPESLCSRGVTISHQFRPVSAVGGDFLDYFELTDGSIGLYLGDVSGKGLPAALFGAMAVGTIRGVHKTGTSADQVLATMNRRLMLRGTPTRHAALQYAVFRPVTREIQISGRDARTSASHLKRLPLARVVRHPSRTLAVHKLRCPRAASRTGRLRSVLHRRDHRFHEHGR